MSWFRNLFYFNRKYKKVQKMYTVISYVERTVYCIHSTPPHIIDIFYTQGIIMDPRGTSWSWWNTENCTANRIIWIWEVFFNVVTRLTFVVLVCIFDYTIYVNCSFYEIVNIIITLSKRTKDIDLSQYVMKINWFHFY